MKIFSNLDIYSTGSTNSSAFSIRNSGGTKVFTVNDNSAVGINLGSSAITAMLHIDKTNDGTALIKAVSDGISVFETKLSSFSTVGLVHTFDGIGGGTYDFIADANPTLRWNTRSLGQTLTIGGSIPTITTTRPTMVIDAPILGIGIGYPSASSKVHVQGEGATSATYALKVDNSASSPLLYVRNDGNVGIGVNTAAARLDISGGTGNPFLAQSTINGSGTFGIFRNNDEGFDAGQEIQIDFQQQTSTLSRMSSAYFGGSDFGFNFYGNSGFLNSTPIMTLRGTGNVGIGMTGGTHKLNVNGNIGLSGISNTYNIGTYEVLKISQGSGAINISLGNNNTIVDADNGGAIAIGTSVLAASDGIAIGLNASATTGTIDGIAIGRAATVSNGSIRGIAIGREASVTASNAFAIGNYTTASQDDTIILGNNSLGNKPKVGIGFSTPTATLDISGNTSSGLLRINNSNFSFANKLLLSNDGSFYNGSINSFGGFGTGTFQTDHLTYTLNTSFSTFLAFSNNGGSGNRTSYGIIGAPLSSADTNYRLTLINNDAGTIGNVLNILSTASSSTNDSFDYYSYGINLVSNGLHINSGSGNYHKIGLNVDVSGADINYAALFNGGNVGIGTSVPDAKLSILTPTSTTALGLNSNSTTDTIVELATNNAAAFRSKIYLEDSTQTLNFYTKNNDTIFWNGNGLAQSKTLTLFTDTSAKFENSVGIGATATSMLDINGASGSNQLRLRTSFTPTGTTDGAGNTGDFAWDADYLYMKTGAGWKRSTLATW